MRRFLRFGVLCGVLTLLLCVSAFAANVTEAGLYDLKSEKTNVSLVAGKGGTQFQTVPSAYPVKLDDKGVLVQDEAGGDYYPGAESVKVTVIGADAAKQYLLIAMTDDVKVVKEDNEDKVKVPTPTRENIIYIDQNSGDKAEFVVFPKSLGKATYYIYLSSTDVELEKVASFASYIPYKLGDVNNDGPINIKDAMQIIYYIAGKNSVVKGATPPTMADLAANVNGDSKINIQDVMQIIYYIAGKNSILN